MCQPILQTDLYAGGPATKHYNSWLFEGGTPWKTEIECSTKPTVHAAWMPFLSILCKRKRRMVVVKNKCLRVLQTALRDSLGKGHTLQTNCRLVLLNSTEPGIALSPWIVLEFLSFFTNRFVKTSTLNSSLQSELKTAASAAASWWSVW